MDKFYEIVGALNDVVWGPYTIMFLIGTGIFLSFKFGFVQIKYFPRIIRNTIGTAFKKDASLAGEILSGQAAFPSIAGVVGTGNLADTANGLLIIPNLIGVIYLSTQVKKLGEGYFSKKELEKN